MTNEVTTTKQTSVSNVDISPVISEVIEYVNKKIEEFSSKAYQELKDFDNNKYKD